MSESNITKNALAEAMKELMQEKVFEKISISDICDKCSMNRKSFYYHFRDKYDLVNWIFYIGFMDNVNLSNYEIEIDDKDAGQKSGFDAWGLLTDTCHYLYKEKDFYSKALKIEGQNSFKDYFHDVLYPIMMYFVSDVSTEEEHEDFFVTFMCDAFIASLVRWLTDAKPMEPDMLLAEFKSLTVKLAKRIIDDIGTQA